jgi:hypothetical protein
MGNKYKQRLFIKKVKCQSEQTLLGFSKTVPLEYSSSMNKNKLCKYKLTIS